MGLLTKEQIAAVDDRPFEDVPVPEWGGTVRVRAIDGVDRDAFEGSINPADGPRNVANLRARLLVKSIVGEDGQRLYKDADADALGKRSGVVLDRLADVAKRLSKLGKDAIEEDAKALKNVQSDASSSASALPSESSTPTT